ncbi:MAG: hypothetical protein ACK5F0_06735 [Flavobacteriales bacterium]|jgi:hypothetical protein
MKYLFLLLLTAVFNIMYAQDITFTSDKRLVQPTVNGEVKAENTIEIKSSLKKPLNGKKTYTWTINGSSEPGKGWELVKGTTLSGEKIKISFNKIGNYSVGLTIVAISGEDENEVSGEVEDFISVRSVFPELAALYAQKPVPNYVKLVEKSSEYTVKPKFANDPTPNLFLAKGYLGLVKSGNPEPRFETAIEDCISSFVAAKELDKNGVIMDDEHQRFLDELQQYLLNENILVNYDADPKSNPESYDQLVEYIDYYSQTTSAPVCASLMQGYFKYLKKDSKGANLLWNTEILKLKKYVNLDEKTAYGERYKDDLGNEIILSTVDLKVLKLGAMKVAQVMKTRDNQNPKEACKLLSILEPFLIDDTEFATFYSKEFNSCQE